MRAPERGPTGGARRAAIPVGTLLALPTIPALIWTFASPPPPGRRDMPGAVPVDPRPDR